MECICICVNVYLQTHTEMPTLPNCKLYGIMQKLWLKVFYCINNE